MTKLFCPLIIRPIVDWSSLVSDFGIILRVYWENSLFLKFSLKSRFLNFVLPYQCFHVFHEKCLNSGPVAFHLYFQLCYGFIFMSFIISTSFRRKKKEMSLLNYSELKIFKTFIIAWFTVFWNWFITLLNAWNIKRFQDITWSSPAFSKMVKPFVIKKH